MSVEIEGNSAELGKLDVKMVKAKRRKDGNVSLLGVVDSGEETVVAPSEKNEKGEPRVTFTKDPETGALVFSDGHRIDRAEIIGVDVAAAHAEAASILAEAVQVRQSGLDFVAGLQTAKKAPNVQVVTSSGVEFWHRPFSGMEVVSLGMMLYREGDAVNVDSDFDKSRLPDLITKTLATFLVRGESDDAPLFADEAAAKAFIYHPNVKTEAIEVTTAIMASVPNFMSLLSAA